ncbi:hypothetical protein M8818_001152 [Zalaria obscura]|uniref:Uncharacterized protein n=1 Tax=Zalaria obscura TaxID=2024903 RepID=A0ACC3SPP8_9PEZI
MAREHWQLPEEIPETSSVHDGEHEVESTFLARAGPLHNRCPFKTTSFLTPLLPLQPEFTFPGCLAPRKEADICSSSDDPLPITDSLDPPSPAHRDSSPVGGLQQPSATIEAPTSAQLPVGTSPNQETPVTERPAPARYPKAKRGHSEVTSDATYPDNVSSLKKLCTAKDRRISDLELEASNQRASEDAPLGEVGHVLIRTIEMILDRLQYGNAANIWHPSLAHCLDVSIDPAFYLLGTCTPPLHATWMVKSHILLLYASDGWDFS